MISYFLVLNCASLFMSLFQRNYLNALSKPFFIVQRSVIKKILPVVIELKGKKSVLLFYRFSMI